MMNPKWIAAALCALLASSLGAQSTSSTKERIRKEVAEKQRLMREGKVVLSNVRVTVRLANGSRLRGVVKNGKFIERHDGLAFVPSERAIEGSGLRIWYYDQTNSYIFLPWNTIVEHSIGEVLSDEEVTKMGIELDRLAKQAKEQADGAQRQPAGPVDPQTGKSIPTPAGQTPPPAGPIVESKPQSALTPEQLALLAEFPPEQGWSLDKLKEIEARKIRIGVFPNEQEKRFLEVFAAWNEANQLREAEAARTGGPADGPAVVTTTPTTGPAPKLGNGPPVKPPGR